MRVHHFHLNQILFVSQIFPHCDLPHRWSAFVSRKLALLNQPNKETDMPTAMQMQYHNTHKHEALAFIPEKYRDTVKVALLVPTGLAALPIFLLLGQSM